jgi:hypothetical protein
MDGYGFQGQLTRLAPVGLVSGGLRSDVGFAGTVTDGPLAGSTIEGVDYLLIRHDGVGVIDARELITTADETTVSVHAEGYIVPPFEVPDLRALADPSFSWPDVDLPMHGSARLQSAVPALEVVNRSVYSFTGAVNMARGSLVVTARRINADVIRHDAKLLARQ